MCTNVKIIFLHTISHNSDMFRPILIIFRGRLNINKGYIITWMSFFFGNFPGT